jgi:ribosome biogenesis GTPase A
MVKKTKKTGIEEYDYERINWFPGHMNKATQEIKKKIKLVDIILEVRDARTPLASGNKENYQSHANNPYLIVINKTNLADPQTVKLWESWFTEQKENFIFINALDKKSIQKIVKRSKEIIHTHRLKSNKNVKLKTKMKMMILGLPNTGKSTIINMLANRNASKVAAKPGQTKVQLWVKVDNDLDILDTPGVMPPIIKNQIHGMWLSAIHAIPDHIVPPESSACFIIEHMLKLKPIAFKEHYDFETLDVDLLTACDHIGKRRGCLRSGGGFDYDHIYKIILKDFRAGALGLVSFGVPPKKR